MGFQKKVSLNIAEVWEGLGLIMLKSGIPTVNLNILRMRRLENIFAKIMDLQIKIRVSLQNLPMYNVTYIK